MNVPFGPSLCVKRVARPRIFRTPAPAVMNAIVDTLSEFGIIHIDMPATPYRLWQAIQAAS